MNIVKIKIVITELRRFNKNSYEISVLIFRTNYLF
jgi:hypothetical protein